MSPVRTDWTRRSGVPAALALVGVLCGALAVADKTFGLVHRPFLFASAAYGSLFVLLGWACLRGIRMPARGRVRLSGYASFLILNVLTGAYVFAWRACADPTPLLLQSRLSGGDRLLQAGEKDQAHLVYREALRRYPELYSVLMRMGSVNYHVGDYQKAEKFFRRALERAPAGTQWRVLNYLGQALWKQRRAEEAIAYYERAQRSGLPADGPERIEWHYLLGWAYFDVRDYEAAIRHYGAVAAAGQKYAAASYYNIACAQAQQLKALEEGPARKTLLREAVENLRRAWKATSSADELKALREGLVGTPDQRDPELEPLHGAEELTAFLREVRGV